MRAKRAHTIIIRSSETLLYVKYRIYDGIRWLDAYTAIQILVRWIEIKDLTTGDDV